MSFSPYHSLRWLYTFIVVSFQRIIISIVAAGPIPKHIAIVMDGNRRYASKKGNPIIHGHLEGYWALRRTLELSFRLGVRCLSVYTFAIDNFQRSPEEVAALMKLFDEKVHAIVNLDRQFWEENDARFNFLGKTSLLSERSRTLIRIAEELTKNRTRLVNVMIPYSSRDEITTTIQNIGSKVRDDDLSLCNVTEEDIYAELFTTKIDNSPVDVLIRTSGVRRFSDFLLWQCCENVQVHFIPVFWPDFGFRHLIPIILSYQRKIWYKERLMSN